MAVDVYSENFLGINSPTFSFSNDIQQNKITSNPISSLIDNSMFDFAFHVDKTIGFESSTADELFCNGKMLPTSVKKQEIVGISCVDSEFKSGFESSRKKCLKEFLEDSSEDEEVDNNVVVSKPFWKFRRSNSLNCDRNNQKKSLIGSWKILSRSGSTGKFLEKIVEENEKKSSNNLGFFGKFTRSSLSRGDISNQVVVTRSLSSDQNTGTKKCVKLSGEVLRRSNSTSDNYVMKSSPELIRRSNSTGSAPSHIRNKKYQQGQVKNGKGYSFGNYYYSNNNGKVNNTGLNLPSPYISRVSVDLFGMGSLFCNGSTKYKGRKKNDKF